MALPMAGKSDTGVAQVECHGVIVRTEDDPQGGFNIAIFFNEIKDAQRSKITRYVNQFLPSEVTSSN
jgi:hypothetical protein